MWGGGEKEPAFFIQMAESTLNGRFYDNVTRGWSLSFSMNQISQQHIFH